MDAEKKTEQQRCIHCGMLLTDKLEYCPERSGRFGALRHEREIGGGRPVTAEEIQAQREGAFKTGAMRGERQARPIPADLVEENCPVCGLHVYGVPFICGHREYERMPLRPIWGSNGHLVWCSNSTGPVEDCCTCRELAAAEKKRRESVEVLCEDEGCPHHGTPHVCVDSRRFNSVWLIEARWRTGPLNREWATQADFIFMTQEEADKKVAELTQRNTLSEWRTRRYAPVSGHGRQG